MLFPAQKRISLYVMLSNLTKTRNFHSDVGISDVAN